MGMASKQSPRAAYVAKLLRSCSWPLQRRVGLKKRGRPFCILAHVYSYAPIAFLASTGIHPAGRRRGAPPCGSKGLALHPKAQRRRCIGRRTRPHRRVHNATRRWWRSAGRRPAGDGHAMESTGGLLHPSQPKCRRGVWRWAGPDGTAEGRRRRWRSRRWSARYGHVPRL